MNAELLTKTNEELLIKMFRCLLKNTKNLTVDENAYDDEEWATAYLWKTVKRLLLRLEDKS